MSATAHRSTHAHAGELSRHPAGLPDARHLAVAQETGYAPHEVLSRGIAFCRANPRAPRDDFDFDQDASARFDAVIADGFRRVTELQAVERRQTPTPTGFVDRDFDAEALVAEYDPIAVAHRMTIAKSEAAAERSVPIYLRRVEGRGGVAIEAKLGDTVIFTSATMSVDDADTSEPHYRTALHAYAASLKRTAA